MEAIISFFQAIFYGFFFIVAVLVELPWYDALLLVLFFIWMIIDKINRIDRMSDKYKEGFNGHSKASNIIHYTGLVFIALAIVFIVYQWQQGNINSLGTSQYRGKFDSINDIILIVVLAFFGVWYSFKKGYIK